MDAGTRRKALSHEGLEDLGGLILEVDYLGAAALLQSSERPACRRRQLALPAGNRIAVRIEAGSAEAEIERFGLLFGRPTSAS